MKCKAEVLLNLLSRLNTYGGSKIASSNVLFYIDKKTFNLYLAAASASTFVKIKSEVIVKKDDSFFFENCIGICKTTLQEIFKGFGSSEIEMFFTTENESKVLNIKSADESQEEYQLQFLEQSDDDKDKIFLQEDENILPIVIDLDVKTLKPLSSLITNVGTFCSNNQYRTIIHRIENQLSVSCITNTVLSSFTVPIPDNDRYEPKTAYGIDTVNADVTLLINQFITGAQDTDKISIYYKNNQFILMTGNVYVKTTFISKSQSIAVAHGQVLSLKAVAKADSINELVIKCNSKLLDSNINKASLMYSKGRAKSIENHIPMYIMSDKEVLITNQATNGKYSCTMNKEIEIEGLDEDYVPKSTLYNINVLMIRSILGIINTSDISKRVSIDMRETLDKKFYIIITPENSNKLEFIMRLRK